MLLDFSSSVSEIGTWLHEFFIKVASISFGPADFLDIILVSVVVYYAIRFFKGTKALQLLKGLILLALGYAITYLLKMETSLYLFRYLFQNIFIILIIVFQPEIRQAVERIGRQNLGLFRGIFSDISSTDDDSESVAIVEICKAVQRMSDSKTGALIVFEKATLPTSVTETGTFVDAAVSHELIGNIFYPKSPLHDGAAIIRNGRVFKAGCVLPNTRSDNVSSELGTRHRAALGISEETDSVTVVVSEETGQISVAYRGELTRDYDEFTLNAFILSHMEKAGENSGKNKGIFSDIFKKGKKK